MQDLLQRLGIYLNYNREFLLLGLILTRTMVTVVLSPILGGKVAPTEVKMGFGVLLTMLVYPLARDSVSSDIPITAVSYSLLMIKEIFVGLAIGFVATHVFSILEMAGRMIDTARGTSMAEVMVPHIDHRATPIGDLYYQLFLVLFMYIGGLPIFIEAFFYSFQAIPIDQGLAIGKPLEPFFFYMVRLGGDLLIIATILAAPVIASTLIIDIVFGILNRVAPQLNAYFLSMPVKAMGGLAVVLIIMAPFVERLYYYATWQLRAIEKTIELLVTSGPLGQ